jgi:hypothetical protein
MGFEMLRPSGLGGSRTVVDGYLLALGNYEVL